MRLLKPALYTYLTLLEFISTTDYFDFVESNIFSTFLCGLSCTPVDYLPSDYVLDPNPVKFKTKFKIENKHRRHSVTTKWVTILNALKNMK